MSKTSLAQVTPVTGASAVDRGGCPCGRSHPSPGKWRRKPPRKPVDHGVLTGKAYQAFADGKADFQGGRWVLRYAGSCERPIPVKQHASRGALLVTTEVRCRKCPSCRRAAVGYWAAAGMNMSKLAQESGKRSWFGTLTFAPEWQRVILDDAREEWMRENAHSSEVPDWWNEPLCDYRFALVRKRVVKELQKYWKRLRKAGHVFSYLVVIERHKSGLPHVHYLLHEQQQPIRKADQQAQWPFGFSKISIVGGRSRNAAAPEKAAFYVVKYLSKSEQARQMASQGYRPKPRSAAKVYRRSRELVQATPLDE